MGEIQKYNPGELVKSVRLTQALAKMKGEKATIETALAKLEQPREQLQRIVPRQVEIVRPKVIDVVDLWRVCAVTGKLYASRYVLKDGKWLYGQGVRHFEGYNAVSYRDVRASIPNEHLSLELCPWCRSEGHAGIYCPRCKRFACWGKTVANYFRCFCSKEGDLIDGGPRNDGGIPA